MKDKSPSKRTILYYPFIGIPPSWLRQTVLYWDEIGSIMPSNIRYERIPAGEDLYFLEREGIYRPFSPGYLDNFRDENFAKFEKEFLSIYGSFPFQRLLRSEKAGMFRSKYDMRSQHIKPERPDSWSELTQERPILG